MHNGVQGTNSITGTAVHEAAHGLFGSTMIEGMQPQRTSELAKLVAEFVNHNRHHRLLWHAGHLNAVISCFDSTQLRTARPSASSASTHENGDASTSRREIERSTACVTQEGRNQFNGCSHYPFTLPTLAWQWHARQRSCQWRRACQSQLLQPCQRLYSSPADRDSETFRKENGDHELSKARCSASCGSWPPPTVHWIEDAVPRSALPYIHLARVHKPIGTWLLLWPCVWSICLASPGQAPDLYTLGLFSVGALLLRGAGCTINDMWDRNLDAQVERTKYRPLAAKVVSMPAATAFLAAQLSAGLVVLLQLNAYSQVLGASSLALVATYPLMKRVTNLPQAYLGLTINWGALLGWAAVQGSCDWSVVLPLYFSAVSWTLFYDTIYAHMDKRDDAKAGIQSTALAFGGRTKRYLYGFAAVAAGLQVVTGAAADCGTVYYGAVAASTSHLLWQAAAVDLDRPASCLAKFKSNSHYGAILATGIALDRMLATTV